MVENVSISAASQWGATSFSKRMHRNEIRCVPSILNKSAG